MNETLIELEGLSFRYGAHADAFVALKDLSLTIKRGEFVAITGTSGSGKSTLMNLLGTLATTKDGAFSIDGTNTAHLKADELSALRNRQIGFVFQQFHLLPRLSILENILLPMNYLQPRPDAAARLAFEKRALDLLEQLGIREQSDKTPSTLSGGQKQRAAIARALLMDPSILLADEPTGALDSKSSAEVMKIFTELHAEGRTVILITHDPEVAGFAQRRIELKDGRIAADYQQPGRLMDTVKGREEPAAVPSPTHDEPRFPVHPRRWQSMATIRQAWQALASSKLRTALTCLGLIIGVTSITTMLTLGTAAQDVILKIFDHAGADRVYVGLDSQAARKKADGLWQGLDHEQDLPALQATFADFGRISMIWSEFSQNAVVAGKSAELMIDTIDDLPTFLDEGMKISKGQMFAPQELQKGGLFAIVGSEFAKKFFPEKYPARFSNPDFPVGEIVSLRGKLLTSVMIVGVLNNRDVTFSNKDLNERLFVPLSTRLHYMTNKRTTWVSAMPIKGVNQRWLADSIKHYLELKTGLRYPFRAQVPEETVSSIMSFVTVFQALTTLIGALCILVGGIGIMNIMLVTITERIKEIGLRKALGARGRDIIQQFLTECMMLCIFSGIVGVAVGFIFCNLVAIVGHLALPNLISTQILLNPTGIILGLGTAIICGMTFGMMPALRASQLDPSEALRSE